MKIGDVFNGVESYDWGLHHAGSHVISYESNLTTWPKKKAC